MQTLLRAETLVKTIIVHKPHFRGCTCVMVALGLRYGCVRIAGVGEVAGEWLRFARRTCGRLSVALPGLRYHESAGPM
jgi:hypothetical protein